MEALYQNLRTIRHAINNNVAVIMAMAELTQRNPAQCQKLTQLCLDKAPQIAASIGAFTELFRASWETGVAPVQWNAVRSDSESGRSCSCSRRR